MNETIKPAPAFSGFAQNFRADVTSGFLVFLIALPLCLAISLACGVSATAGVFTAIIGGLISPWISNSELTIKGPAAGMIAIVLGCVVEFGGGPDATPEAKLLAYKLMIGVGVVSGVLQIVFALLRTGFVSELFPTAAVHGMLAAIGVIIISKQSHMMLGVKPHAKEPLELLAEIPKSIGLANPEIAFIGIVSLIILFAWPLIKIDAIRKIPGQLVVAILGVILGYAMDLEHTHTFSMFRHDYSVGPNFLVAVPSSIVSAVVTPDFSGVMTGIGLKWIVMFVLIGSLESLLSAKAVDVLDPARRKTDFNRDLLAVGVGNTLAALIGGLPMISEIVRSKANIDNGAKSRFANMFHGVFLLTFVALLPGLIHRIPLASLAAMLVFTGFRLAHPREFAHMYHIGREQLLIFVGTLLGVLMSDLLIGVFIGLGLKIAVHLFSGVSFGSFFHAAIETDEPDENTLRVKVNNSAVFSTWLAIRKAVMAAPAEKTVILDLSMAPLVDHSTMEKLHHLQDDFFHEGRHLLVVGLREHAPVSHHPLATRKKGNVPPDPEKKPVTSV